MFGHTTSQPASQPRSSAHDGIRQSQATQHTEARADTNKQKKMRVYNDALPALL